MWSIVLTLSRSVTSMTYHRMTGMYVGFTFLDRTRMISFSPKRISPVFSIESFRPGGTHQKYLSVGWHIDAAQHVSWNLRLHANVCSPLYIQHLTQSDHKERIELK